MRIVQINTTAFEEEDFYLLTNLSNSNIEKIITPIVQDERISEIDYDNVMLVKALKKAYPTSEVTLLDIENSDYLTI